ncbi:ATP-binding protein [Streptomyces sp. NPDC002055]|uniref:ATP-binding protein n=1 Tax=Streptomyces sp. NPDC002055 TaxID=3154534 RepID=UPI00331C3F87
MAEKMWELPFLAEAEGIASLRRLVRTRLDSWGLSELTDSAQLCVSELVANVVTHVGIGTPATLALSVEGSTLRVEVADPDGRGLPVLLAAGPDAESGRGMRMVDAVAVRWGVAPTASGKTTWCEIAAGSGPEGEQVGRRSVIKAEALLTLYGRDLPPLASGATPLRLVAAEEAAVDLIADLLHWLRAHGCDPEQTLDRAQMHFEADL